ncbi:unnamed protein product [Mytilus coruscus]|uniref:Uncharacterized protein n=1 Tax=Mytilus coruscus TaxID=42192 RepID=A0A6J8ASF8_MYTCO|nr:unnamed protein product [Mytilus coruscus]
MMIQEEWSLPDEIFSSDACGSRYGGWFNGTHFHRVFHKFIIDAQLHINCLELLSVIVCVKLWPICFKGKNQISVALINTGRARDEFLQDCLQKLCYITTIYEFEVRAVHLAGSENRVTDYLFRWHLSDEFSSLFYDAVTDGLQECSVDPKKYLKLLMISS